MSLAGLKVKRDFIGMRIVPFDLVIGRPTSKRLGGELDFKCKEARLDYRGRKKILPMVSEYSRSQELFDGTNSEDFTSDSDSADPLGAKVEIDEMGQEEELVLTLRDQDASEDVVRNYDSDQE